MTTEIKAPRPCTLPKGWTDKGMAFKTVTFDSNKFQALTVTKLDSNSFRLILEADIVHYSEVMSYHDVLQLQMQTIQAIASAQRPWLKAEGFEFVERQQYIIPYYVAGDEQDGDRIIDWYEHRGVFTFKKKERRGMGEDSEGYSLFHVTSNRFEGYNAIYSGTQYHNEVYSPKYFKPYIPYDPTDIRDQRLVKEQEAWKALEYVEVAEV
jgi:hypothetical protein